MNLQLENKLALVSGSTAGIGLAIAKALTAEGARVIVNGRSEARVKGAIASIRANVPTAKLEGLVLDLSKADAAAGQHEVIGMSGDIALYEGKPVVHTHMLVGDSDGTTQGGHVLAAYVSPTLEVMVTVDPVTMQKRFDPDTDLTLIDPSPANKEEK